MITIFSIPKAFNGHIEIIQRNAIGSWTRLQPNCEIVICGNDSGTEQVAKEYNVKCIPEISRNSFGTPLLSSAFAKVKELASNNLLCYINADIILLSDFVSSLRSISTDRILLFGNRWNVNITEAIDFERKAWETELRRRVRQEGSLQPPVGSDYFVFRKDEALAEMPPFPVGRAGWDNWFIYNARKKRYKVIDASKAITVVHQNHDYSHLGIRGIRRPVKLSETYWTGWEGEGASMFRELMKGVDEKLFRILDATHVLTERKLKVAIDYKHLRRMFDTLPVFYPKLGPLHALVQANVIAPLRKAKMLFWGQDRFRVSSAFKDDK